MLCDTVISDMYKTGSSCAEIAQQCGCSETYIYKLLKNIGVEIRSRSEANQTFPDSVFIAAYNIGLSANQSAQLLGVDASTVTKRLQSIGFPLRPKSVASKIRYSSEEFKRFFMTPEVIEALKSLAKQGG